MNSSVPAAPWRQRFAGDARAILRLGGPLIVNNLAITGMTFTDTIMAGRLSAGDLAAVAVGSAYYVLFYLTGLGVLMALSPLVAHACGANQEERVGTLVRQGLWLSQLLAAVLLLPLIFAQPIMTLIGIDAQILPKAVGFVHAIAFGLPAALAYLALRFMSEGIGWTRPIMYTALLALVANVAGCYVLMYGKLGFPALGAVGTGVSNALVLWLMLFFMLRYVRRHRVYERFAVFAQFERPRWSTLRDILGLGAPICGSVVSEAGLFVGAALIMGSLGATQVAAHQIALNYAALMFMIPLSLHSATTIHVGHVVGSGRPEAGRFAGWVGIALCAGFMAVSAVGIFLFNESIAALYTQDAAVHAMAASLLLMAAIFQVSDGLQVGAAGALRGFKDAKIPMLLNLVSYWGVGFPLAWYLGVARGGGPVAVWGGLIAGLTVCAVLLNLRYWKISGDGGVIKGASSFRR